MAANLPPTYLSPLKDHDMNKLKVARPRDSEFSSGQSLDCLLYNLKHHPGRHWQSHLSILLLDKNGYS